MGVRARRAAPYLADVAQALHRQGWTTTAAAPTVHHPADDVVIATLTLDGPTPPAAALVWDERHGWRTVTPSPKAGPSRPKAAASGTSPPAPHPRRTP
ncbi:DUF6292 family protein [Streptomyces griseus]